MIQVIRRAPDILEYKAKDGGPKTVSQIAGYLKLNPGTCANIIKTLPSTQCIEKLEILGRQNTITTGGALVHPETNETDCVLIGTVAIG